MKIEIKSAQINTLSGISKRTGNPYEMRKQAGWVHLGKAYPVEIEIGLEKDQQAYPPGLYSLSPDSFYVDRNKNICVKPVLVPVPLTAAKPAA